MQNKIFLALLILLIPLSCAHLEDSSTETRDPTRTHPDRGGRRAVAAETQIPLEGLYDNPESQILYKILNSASHSIDIEIYEMYDKKFLDLLNSAMDRKVKIRLIKDPAPVGGDKCKLFPEYVHTSKHIASAEEVAQNDSVHNCELQMQVKERILSEGGEFIPFNKELLCGKESRGKGQCFQHGKIVVIDKEFPKIRYALISTGNFNASSLCDLEETPHACNRDFSYVTSETDAISSLENIFENDLAQKRATLEGISSKITVSPFSMAPLVAFIGTAQTSLQIENQYLKDPTLNEAIMAVARRGIPVEVQVASLTEFSSVKVTQVKPLCSLFNLFQDAGVKVRIFTKQMMLSGKSGYLHAKAIVVDKKSAWVGSVNGSTTSLEQNREYGIFFNTPKDVKFLSEILASDYHHENSVSWNQQLDCAQ